MKNSIFGRTWEAFAADVATVNAQFQDVRKAVLFVLEHDSNHYEASLRCEEDRVNSSMQALADHLARLAKGKKLKKGKR